MRAKVLLVVARAEQYEVGYAETHRRLSEALELFDRTGDRRQMGRVLHTMAYLSLDADELEIADAEAGRCIAIANELEHPIGQAVACVVQVWVAIERGDLVRARTLLAQTIATARDSGYQALIAYCVAARAALAAAEGDDGEGARLLGALSRAGGSLGGEGASAVRKRIANLSAAIEAKLGAERFAAFASEGAGLTLEEIAATPLTA